MTFNAKISFIDFWAISGYETHFKSEFCWNEFRQIWRSCIWNF